MSEIKVQRSSFAASILCTLISFTWTPLSVASLPNCSKIYSGVMKLVEKETRAVAAKYYEVKKLAPITISKNRRQVVDIKLLSVGWYERLNPGVDNGGYRGAVPKTALSAVEVNVIHKPYRGNPVSSNFLVIAKMRMKGWITVAENASV